MTTTWRQLLADTKAQVGAADGKWIVEEASGYEGAELVLHLDDPAEALCVQRLGAMVARRLDGEPLQYVLGRWGFRTLDLMVDRRVLIPRPETEQVVGWAIEEMRGRPHVIAADLGTGSGAIGISLAVELRAEVWATDVSRDALDVARANLAGAGMWAATRVRIAEGHWWDALPTDLRGRLDLVVSNPPYVFADDPLPSEVEDYEPSLALRAGAEGMDAINEIVAGAPEWLAPGGVLVMEIDPRHGPRLRDHGEIRIDALGRERALVLRRG